MPSNRRTQRRQHNSWFLICFYTFSLTETSLLDFNGSLFRPPRGFTETEWGKGAQCESYWGLFCGKGFLRGKCFVPRSISIRWRRCDVRGGLEWSRRGSSMQTVCLRGSNLHIIRLNDIFCSSLFFQLLLCLLICACWAMNHPEENISINFGSGSCNWSWFTDVICVHAAAGFYRYLSFCRLSVCKNSDLFSCIEISFIKKETIVVEKNIWFGSLIKLFRWSKSMKWEL